MNDIEQGQLLDAITRGEDHAFAQLTAPCRAELQRFATRIAGGDAGLGEEILQEALLNAYRSLRAGARPQNVRAWLYAIVRNRALNALRGQRPAVPLPEEGHGGPHDAAAHAVEQREWLSWLMGAIGALPPRQRDALVAHAFEGRSHREIAGSMGTSVPAVKTLLHRARRTLQAAQPSSLATTAPGALVRLARRTGAHARGVLAAKLGTKGAAAAGWQVLVAASVAASVAIVAHGGTGAAPAKALTPSAHLASAAGARHGRDRRSARTREAHTRPPAQVSREARRAVRRCLNGKRLGRGLSSEALRYAERHLSEDAREYSDCQQVFRHAQLERIRSRRQQRRRRRV